MKIRNYDEDGDFDELAKVEKINKKSHGKSKTVESPFVPEENWIKISGKAGFGARVVEVHKRYCFISTEKEPGKINTRDVWLATVAKRYLTLQREERNFICVGDRVLCVPDSKQPTTSDRDDHLPRCVIEAVAPRKSQLSRVDPLISDRRHVLASNVDQLLVIASYLDPLIKWGLIDRYLVLAELEHLPAIVVLNKADLLIEKGEPDFVEQCRIKAEAYREMGYQVLEIQANDSKFKKSDVFKEIKTLLKDKISIVSGHSGVGKSTIVNLFKPEIIQVVEPDSNIFYKGRHTTSYASFIKLGTGGYLIDTPGIRSFVIETLAAKDLAFGFRDIHPYAGKCKFRGCRHLDEPDCAVRQAVDDGKIKDWRYKSYKGILLGTTGREGRMRDQHQDSSIDLLSELSELSEFSDLPDIEDMTDSEDMIDSKK